MRRAIDLLGINPVSGNRVLFKPNFNSADEAPGSTHADVLREMVIKLTDMGAQSITMADRSGMGNTRAVMKQKGVFDLADEFSEGLAAAEINGSVGYIGPDGNFVVEPQFVYAEPFEDGTALAVSQAGDRLVVLDMTGQVVLELPLPD